MKHFIYNMIICIIGLCGCKKTEPVIENQMLLRGQAGRLWFLNKNEGENPRYLWFDQYGHFRTLEFGLANEPSLVIPYENYPQRVDSGFESLVFLNGLPYRMFQSDYDGWVGSDGEILTRTFTPVEDNFEWYRKWIAHYTLKTEKMYWFLSETFIPDDNYPLNGQWKSLSDSLILLNGQPYRMIETEIQLGYWWDELELYPLEVSHQRWLTLHNTETGDSIRLLDACFPPYIENYRNMDRKDRIYYEEWIKKRKKNIKSSVLLKGEKYKLYEVVIPDDGYYHRYWHRHYSYYDENGFSTGFVIAGDSTYSKSAPDYSSGATLWYQKGNTIVIGWNSQSKYTILEVSSSGDSIRLWDEGMDMEYLYIDTKLPPSRKRK